MVVGVAATRYRIVPEKSLIWAEAKSSLHAIRAESSAIVGHLDADVAADRLAPSSTPCAHVEFEVQSMKSGNRLFDMEVERRLDARRYPLVKGDVRDVAVVGADPGHYQVQGDIAFHGVTKRIGGLVTLKSLDTTTLQIEGSVALDMRDFDITPPNYVDPMFKISVRVVAEREKA